MKSLVLIVVGAVIAVSASASPPSPRWGGPVVVDELGGSGQAWELKTADMNRDGLRDVVIVQVHYPDFDTFPLTVLLNRGRGRFVDATSSLFEGPVVRTQGPRAIVVADFNGDGRPDIFIADTGTDVQPLRGHQNELVLSTSHGGLRDATANLPQQKSFTHSAAAADVDGNGTVDLYLGSFSCCGDDKTPPQLLLNDGTGRFTVTTDRLDGGSHGPNFSPYTSSAFVDVNGDGSPDLALGGMENWPRSIVLVNDGRGRFRYFADLPPKVYGDNGIVLDIVAVDLNKDGALDLLQAETQTKPYYIGARVQVLINDGRGNFRDETAARFPQQPTGQSWPNRLLVEDFNDDGHADLAIQYAPQGIVATPDPTPFWLNRGDGVLQSIAGARSGAVPHARGPVGFVEGAGRHAFFSVEASHDTRYRRYFLSAQIVGEAPNGVVASRSLRSGIRIAWRTAAGATSYEVWRSTSPRGARSLVGVTAVPKLLDRTARRGRVYYYAVRAVSADGTSDFSRTAVGRRA